MSSNSLINNQQILKIKKLIKTKNYEEAIEKLEVLKNSDNPEIYFLLGSLYLNKNEFIKADQSLRQSIKLDDKNPRSFHNLGILNLLQNNLDEAKSFFKLAYSKDSNYLNSLVELGKIYEIFNR